MTAGEYMLERKRLIETRKKINDARRDLDLARQLSLFPAKKLSTVTVKPTKVEVYGWSSPMKVGKEYTVHVDDVRLGAGGRTARVDLSLRRGNNTYMWYSVNVAHLEVVHD